MAEMTQNHPMRIHAIVCTYHPEFDLLKDLLQALKGQVTKIWVVDDGSCKSVQQQMTELISLWNDGYDIELRCQSCNEGLATALNLGVALAGSAGASHCLFFDQDSCPAPDMVRHLVETERQLLAAGEKLAGVGPLLVDALGRPLKGVMLHSATSRLPSCQDTFHARIDLLVTSGALIRQSVLEEIGGMNSSFFIDNVDLEWSFRARAHGYTLWVSYAARMPHRLGHVKTVPLIGSIATHSPERLYYSTRNRIHLYFHKDTPPGWAARDFPRLLVKFLIFSVFLAPRLEHFLFMMQGVVHAIFARSGKRK